MTNERNRVCPVALHGSLDNRLRRLIHKPEKILAPFVSSGDTAIDIGCGPGFFTLPMAELTGEGGKTVAVDLQQGMLDMVEKKTRNTHLKRRIILHRAEQDNLNLLINADFALVFYMAHEVPDKVSFFTQIRNTMKETGVVLLIEPPVHVTAAGFRETCHAAVKAGFTVEKGPRLFLDRTAVLFP